MAGSRVEDCVNAAIDALRADATLTTLLGGSSKTYTFVPQNTDAPYVMVYGGDEVPWAETLEVSDDDGDSAGRQVDVAVQCVSTYQGQRQVNNIADRVMELLLDADAYDAVSGFELVQFVRNAGQPPADLNNDGVLWFVRVVTVRVTLV